MHMRCKFGDTDLLMNPRGTLKLGQSDLLYGSKSPGKEVDVGMPAEPYTVGCVFLNILSCICVSM